MKKAFFVLLFIVVHVSLMYGQCPECDGVLNDVYEKTHIQRSDNFAQSFAAWFFSEEFKNQVTSDKAGLSLTVPLDGVPITFGGSNESHDAWTTWSQNKNSTHWDFSHITKEDIYKEVASPEALKVWYNCIATCQQTPLPVIVQSVDNEGVILSFRYNPTWITAPPIINSFVCTGGLAVGTANTQYRGKKMTAGGIAIHFRWADQTTTKGTVILNTSRGSTPTILLTRVIPVNQASLSYFTSRMGDWNNPNETEKVRSDNFKGLAFGMSNVTDNGCPIRSDDGKFCGSLTNIVATSLNQGEFFTNLSYHEWACPGCSAAWSHVLGATPPAVKSYAVMITVKDWGPNSGWELDYDVYRTKIISTSNTVNIAIANNSFVVDVPNNAAYPIVSLQLVNKQSIQFALDGDLPNQLTLTSKTHKPDATEYVFQIKD